MISRTYWRTATKKIRRFNAFFDFTKYSSDKKGSSRFSDFTNILEISNKKCILRFHEIFLDPPKKKKQKILSFHELIAEQQKITLENSTHSLISRNIFRTKKAEYSLIFFFCVFEPNFAYFALFSVIFRILRFLVLPILNT